MAVYLIDYENVYVDGLQGVEELTEQDSVYIFYTQNRCGLTFGLYQQLISCKAQIHLNEVAMSLKNNEPVKNALDIQLMMFTGYVIGTKQSNKIYIISKDKDFRLGMEFYQKYMHDEEVKLQICSSVEAALHGAAPETEEAPVPIQETAPAVSYKNQIRQMLGKHADEQMVETICQIIAHADTLTDLNNGLAKTYHDGQKVKELYHKCKPKFEALHKLAKEVN